MNSKLNNLNRYPLPIKKAAIASLYPFILRKRDHIPKEYKTNSEWITNKPLTDEKKYVSK